MESLSPDSIGYTVRLFKNNLNPSGTISSLSAACCFSSVANFITRQSLPHTPVSCLNVLCPFFCPGDMTSWGAEALAPQLGSSCQCTILVLSYKHSFCLLCLLSLFPLKFQHLTVWRKFHPSLSLFLFSAHEYHYGTSDTENISCPLSHF